MNISNFNIPNQHPYDTFGSYERERFMAWFLIQCIEANDLYASIQTQSSHEDMVYDGFLERVGDNHYRLTKKSVGLLYGVYGK